MLQPIRAVLCDFDGTLIDSFRHGLYKLSVCAKTYGYEYSEELQLTATKIWGAPLEIILTTCFPTASSEQFDGMLEIFERLDHEKTPKAFDGVHTALELLAEQGIIFTIITSRDSRSLEMLLKNDKLHHHFCYIAASDTVEHRKPDPRVFACTMRLLEERGISPDECLLIGDTYDDFRAGQSFGMRTVIVRTGPLSEDQPDIPAENHISSFAELPVWLTRNNLSAVA